MKPSILEPNRGPILIFGSGDCAKTTRTISKIPKDPERARASPKTFLFILVSEFGKWLFRNILEIVSKLEKRWNFVLNNSGLREDYSYDFKNSKRFWKSSGFSQKYFFYFGLRHREVIVSQHFRSDCFKDFEFYISYRRISLQLL